MWVLVGGGGFIGSHLRAALAMQGARVVVVRRSQSLTNPIGPREIDISSDAFATGQGDELLARAEVVVYLATASTPGTFAAAPDVDIAANVPPAMAFFHRVGQLAPQTRMILLSSGGTVYGDNQGDAPIPETALTRPISSYGLSKVMIEQSLAFVSRQTGMSAAVLRIGNPIGMHQRAGSQGIARAMFNAIATGIPLSIYGDGLNVRDYLDADDVAEAITLVGRKRTGSFGVWNIGSGRGCSLQELLAMAGAIAGRPVPVRSAPARAFDVRSIVLDCAKAGADFGWTATTNVPDALAKVWRAMQSDDQGGAAA